jgi:hypothetical protein
MESEILSWDKLPAVSIFAQNMNMETAGCMKLQVAEVLTSVV